MIRVRLTEVPLAVRMKAAQQICRRERAEHVRAEVMAAALMPKETHWLPEAAQPILDGFRQAA